MSTISSDERKKQERTGVIISMIIHSALFVLLFFLVMFKEPEMQGGGGTPGADINFGYDLVGYGDNNTTEQATEEVQQVQEDVSETPVTDPQPDAEQTLNGVPVNEEQPKPKNTNTSQATQQEKPKQQNASGVTNTGQGTDPNTKGNMGTTQGTLDGKSLMGKGNQSGNGQGGTGGGTGGGNGTGNGPGNGSGLAMGGWYSTYVPVVRDDDNEFGKVVVRIKIDNDGNIISITKVESQVSEAKYKECYNEIMKMEFQKTRDNTNTADFSSGTYTFLFRP